MSGKTCKCRLNYYYDYEQTTPETFCQRCGVFTTSCVKEEDLTCIGNDGVYLKNGACICKPEHYFEYFKEDANDKECDECHNLCKTCFGFLPSQCTSCDLERYPDAVFVSDNTCRCITGKYWDNYLKACMNCSPLCIDCSGPTNYDCLACNSSITFNVEDQPNWCFIKHELPIGYYLSVNIFKSNLYINLECHEVCETCFEFDLCLSCSSPEKVVYNFTCIDECPIGYFDKLRSCNRNLFLLLACYYSCKNCNDGSDSGCIDCQPGLLFWKGICSSSCPLGSYPSINGSLCLSCNPSCSVCTSYSQCQKCFKGFYLEGETCVSKCIDGKYGDNEDGNCSFCHNVCETCNGPTSSNCFTCNSKEGYTFISAGKCGFLDCEDGSYYSKNKLQCLACDKACKRCKDRGKTQCTECAFGYKNFAKEESSTITCRTCEEYDSRLYTRPDGSCKGTLIYK